MVYTPHTAHMHQYEVCCTPHTAHMHQYEVCCTPHTAHMHQYEVCCTPHTAHMHQYEVCCTPHTAHMHQYEVCCTPHTAHLYTCIQQKRDILSHLAVLRFSSVGEVEVVLAFRHTGCPRRFNTETGMGTQSQHNDVTEFGCKHSFELIACSACELTSNRTKHMFKWVTS